MAGMLEGVKVLEVANWVAAPLACAILADLGADVIKVEHPDTTLECSLHLFEQSSQTPSAQTSQTPLSKACPLS